MIELANDEQADNENDSVGSTGAGTIQWAIRERSDWGIKGVNRNNGTVQKDWVIIKSHELAEGFCLSVIGHAGWAKDVEASVPYSLVISFEAVNQDIEIYSRIEIANQVEVEGLFPFFRLNKCTLVISIRHGNLLRKSGGE